VAVQVRKSGAQQSQRRNSRERGALFLSESCGNRGKPISIDVVEGGRARGSFAPDKRESVSTPIKNPPHGAPAPPITATYYSTRSNSPRRSPATWARRRRHSWPTRKCN